jgi:hypothetical protein
MFPRTANGRRVVLPLILATVLAGEVAGLALAARAFPARAFPAASIVEPAPAAHLRHAPAAVAARDPAAPHRRPEIQPGPARRGASASALAERRGEANRPRPVGNRGATARPDIVSESESVAIGAGTRLVRNHVWIPALGISRSVESFPCSRTRPPDNFVYRWGCAGRNNLYLLGHAYSVFKPLHDAYVRGSLRKGMTVDYADASGHVQRYEIAWWQVVRPTGAASWAWASQPRPSMTLQTCVGANSEYRLMVRLVAMD